MTPAMAKDLWERAAEPARRELPRLRDGVRGAAERLRGMVDTLKEVRFAIVSAVSNRHRDPDGVLAEISRECIAIENAIPKEAANG